MPGRRRPGPGAREHVVDSPFDTSGIEVGADGIRRCALILDRDIVPVTAVPRRPFQGWRYLPAQDAPADMPRGREGGTALPPQMAAALAEMGLV